MKKIARANSEDDLHLGPMATYAHSKSTSHGAGEMSFGARDDGSSMSSSNEYVASSMQARAPMMDRQYSGGSEQHQTTVTHTDELHLPIKWMRGEEDIKLREGTHRLHGISCSND